jgi:hypothetical protein
VASDGLTVGERVPDGGVAADPFGHWQGVGGGASFEEFLQSFVDEPEAGLEFEDGLADYGEPEVAGFDQAGVHGPDRDLVDARAFDGEERVGAFGVAEQASRGRVVWTTARITAAAPTPPSRPSPVSL